MPSKPPLSTRAIVQEWARATFPDEDDWSDELEDLVVLLEKNENGSAYRAALVEIAHSRTLKASNARHVAIQGIELGDREAAARAERSSRSRVGWATRRANEAARERDDEL